MGKRGERASSLPGFFFGGEDEGKGGLGMYVLKGWVSL